MNWHSLLNYNRLNKNQKEVQHSMANKNRSEFEIDFDRIIFSYPFRRLQDKTQVVPLPEHDFVHTRLTHSLEVSSVGRSLGKAIGSYVLSKNPHLIEAGYQASDFGAIVAAACLTHDLGNPPFGHSGERAISEFFLSNRPDGVSEKEYADLTNFEGNAQGFRILASPHFNDLKLTYATLATFSKYPCESIIHQRNLNRKSQKKFGFFQSEKNAFKQVAENCGLLPLSDADAVWVRHPLTFLVEAADDICYLIIDLEDATRMKVINDKEFKDLVAPIIGAKLDEKKLEQETDINQKIGILRAMAINQLIMECTEIFIENEAQILLGNFDTALIDIIPSASYTQAIAKFSFSKIYNSQQVLEIQAAGFEVLPGLIELFWEASEDYIKKGKNCKAKHLNLLRMLPLPYQTYLATETTSYLRARTLVDYISGMTDRYAVGLYKKLKGISI
ncbi:MAG: dNTP triphosphohydrolase [Flavobacteriales bacterium]|nr:dNTP triphosphohydrolase [Flavobacteriales bacterium]